MNSVYGWVLNKGWRLQYHIYWLNRTWLVIYLLNHEPSYMYRVWTCESFLGTVGCKIYGCIKDQSWHGLTRFLNYSCSSLVTWDKEAVIHHLKCLFNIATISAITPNTQHIDACEVCGHICPIVWLLSSLIQRNLLISLGNIHLLSPGAELKSKCLVSAPCFWIVWAEVQLGGTK